MPVPPTWRLRLAVPVLVALLALVGLAVPAAADGGAPVVSRSSGRCLTAQGGSTAPTTPLVIENCDGRPGQAWTFGDPDGDGTGTLSLAGGRSCLDGRYLQDGLRVVVEPCSGAASQRVYADPAGYLRLGSSALCPSVRGASTAAGTPVEEKPCNATLVDLWRSATLPLRTDPPGPPTDLSASDLTCNRVTLHWRDARENTGQTAHWADVYHDGQLVRSVPGSPEPQSLRLTVQPGVTWGLYVNDRDAAGNVSQASPTLPVTPPACAPDTTRPTQVTGLTATVVGGTTAVRLTWNPASDANGVRSYLVVRDGVTVGRLNGGLGLTTETTFLDSGLTSGRAYSYTILARDPSFNQSVPSPAVTVTAGTGCLVCSVRVVATDSDLPWGLTTLPGGTVLYGRRDADQLVLLDPASGRQTVVTGILPGIAGTDGEGGLLGLAIAPTFATDHWLYVMHSTATDNRIVRVRLEGTALDVASEQVLLAGIPRNKFHDGGRLRFGPDGRLYASVGDGQNQSAAQDLSVLGGKILRLNPDGSVPADNPFGNYVWSFGHRNPQGLAFDSKGQLWEQEFGDATQDETNLVVKGRDYGWPGCEGTVGSCSGGGLTAPARTYPPYLGSCSGIAVVKDVLYVACLRGTRLYREVISGSSLTSTSAFLVGTYGRLRTVEPDGTGKGLWLTTSTKGDKDSIAGNSAEQILHVGLNGNPG